MRCDNILFICKDKNDKEQILGYCLYSYPKDKQDEQSFQYENFIRTERCNGEIEVNCSLYCLETELQITYLCKKCGGDCSNNYNLPDNIYALQSFLQEYISLKK